jgi:hypothetical protein
MANDPIYLLKPVFNFVDGLIREQGDRLYVIFFYVCLVVISWILGGGLRREQRAGKRFPPVAPGIVMCLPLAPPRPPSEPPPLIGHDYEPPCCDHEGDCLWN